MPHMLAGDVIGADLHNQNHDTLVATFGSGF
jgi:hypothetical protein